MDIAEITASVPEVVTGLMDWSKSSGDPFRDRDRVEEWMRETTLFGDTEFPCPKCGKVFVTREKRRRHLIGEKEKKAACGPLAGLYSHQTQRPKTKAKKTK
jgi:uncharacterized C2H2 Zn-finger protein